MFLCMEIISTKCCRVHIVPHESYSLNIRLFCVTSVQQLKGERENRSHELGEMFFCGIIHCEKSDNISSNYRVQKGGIHKDIGRGKSFTTARETTLRRDNLCVVGCF